ncbi:MAG TPA: hypothetical protein VFS94_09455 [Gemmatimonadales bacterium]|nr:hypothetical protein [Gemmatimonadales bacterium]
MRPIVAMRLGGLAALLAVTGCDNAHAPSDLTPTRAAAQATGGDVVPLGEFALYVPSTPGKLRGVLVALGGPRTRAFVTGEPTGAPFPPVEAALQELGASFRALADEQRIALLGAAYFGPTALPNAIASDQLILDAIAAGAAASGRPELADAPILIFASSGGAPEASGFTARNAERVAGLFLSVPLSVTALTTELQRQVPTIVALAEFDAFIDNAALTAAVAANRGSGALWGIAMERGVPHHSLSPAKAQLTLAWLEAVLDRRINGASGGIRVVPEQSGWLGNPTTGEISTWGAYSGDRSTANWLPTEAAAEQWRAVAGF